eukprot:62760-Amphidinium_carterae.2
MATKKGRGRQCKLTCGQQQLQEALTQTHNETSTKLGTVLTAQQLLLRTNIHEECTWQDWSRTIPALSLPAAAHLC